MIMILACRPWIICLALAKLYIFNHKKESKKGRPSGPSPHVRVTQQCKATSSHLCMEPKETRQNNSRKYMGHQKERLLCLCLLASTLFTMLSVSNHSICFKACWFLTRMQGGNFSFSFLLVRSDVSCFAQASTCTHEKKSHMVAYKKKHMHYNVV